MPLTPFTATAATCAIVPGSERTDGGKQHVTGRTFTDVVESRDQRIAGTNRPTLDIIFDPATNEGELRGRFVLQPKAVGGTWEGELGGRLIGGQVTSSGIARGTGALEGAVMRVDFQQVPAYPGTPPCENPFAFFEMKGIILE